MPSSPDNSDVEERKPKRRKISNDDDFLYGSNLVLLKVHDKVIAHVSTELFKDACLTGVQLDDPTFWHGVGDLDGLRYTSMNCGINKDVARFLACWINGKDVNDCFGFIKLDEGGWNTFFFTVYGFCVGRGIFDHGLQRELIDYFLWTLCESKATVEKTIEENAAKSQHQLRQPSQQLQLLSDGLSPNITSITHQLQAQFPQASAEKIQELATERLRHIHSKGQHQQSHQQARQSALSAAAGPCAAEDTPNGSPPYDKHTAALLQNNGNGQHTAFHTHPPKDQRGWLTNAFEAYESCAYRDKHLDSLFAALFIHHHPKFLDADEDDESGISLTLRAVRDKALSHFCQAQYGEDQVLVEDPLTTEWGHHDKYYLSPPAESSPGDQVQGQYQSSQG
ncbi:hypothetical protein KCU98_g2393, partial [Aureobasidium melanogenum]